MSATDYHTFLFQVARYKPTARFPLGRWRVTAFLGGRMFARGGFHGSEADAMAACKRSIDRVRARDIAS